LIHQNVRYRGAGRQLAFLVSRGKYILSNVDLDDVYGPCPRDALKFYHENSEGYLLRLLGCCTIAPRDLIVELGGWRDLKYSEDFDLWARAAKLGKYLGLGAELE
jgi:GT2 family glycosyltransferase